LGVCLEPLAIVTEFVAGGSLYDLIHSTKTIGADLNYKIVLGMSAGMVHLEAERLVHRDLAARNVLLTKDLTPVIADFGMSRKLENYESAKTTKTEGLLLSFIYLILML
jgi:serine/threonine protein kinase